MPLGQIIVLIIVFLVVIFFIIALKRRWIGSPSAGIFTGQVLLHDWATKDKQHAIEYIIENQEDLDKRKGASGEGPAGETSADEK